MSAGLPGAGGGRERVVLAGPDAQLVPLYERLRGGELAEVVALGSAEAESLAALLAAIGGLPLLGPQGGEAAPAADLWVCSAEWRERTGGLPCLDFGAAAARWPAAATVPAAPPAPPAPPARPAAAGAAEGAAAAPPARLAPSAAAGEPFVAFARELQREMQRSQRYHLGFTLSILRIVDAGGRALPEAAFREEPLCSLPARLGRACDSWGLSREGYLLHLAPETLEQASALRRRLETALLEAMAGRAGAPWRVETGQARYPQDGEQGKALVDVALRRLLRRLAHGEGDA